MNPISVISVISAIASLLSIVFDVPNKQKVSVSLKTFILILSIASFLFIWAFSPYFRNSFSGEETLLGLENYTSNPTQPIDNLASQPTNQSSSQSMSEPANNSTSNSISDSISESTTDSAGDFITESMTSSIDEPLNDLQDIQVLRVDVIPTYLSTVSPITLRPFEASAVDIEMTTGNIYESGQNIDYEYMPKISGIHRFEFSDVPDGTDLRLEIYNSGWERIKSDYDLDNGDGLTVSLSADNTYYIRVQQYRNLGTYTLNIGPKKSIIDISNVTSISDSIQYTGQENDYVFFANLSGTYRFEFSDVPNGTDLRLEVYNSGWEKIKSDYDLDNGDGLTVSLSAGNTYYLVSAH